MSSSYSNIVFFFVLSLKHQDGARDFVFFQELHSLSIILLKTVVVVVVTFLLLLIVLPSFLGVGISSGLKMSTEIGGCGCSITGHLDDFNGFVYTEHHGQ